MENLLALLVRQSQKVLVGSWQVSEEIGSVTHGEERMMGHLIERRLKHSHLCEWENNFFLTVLAREGARHHRLD